MRYRKFGKTGLEVSALGFGCMRLPVIDNDPGRIDLAEATRMIRHAIEHGVNYVDTAWPYHSEKGEEAVGAALADGYRDKVYLATKSPVWLVKEPGDFDKYLNLQLDRLKTEYIDFYLIHALTRERWHHCRDNQVFDFIRRAKADGRIRHIGFSFHDKLEAFKEIVDDYDWEFCQIQYNYMNENYQAGKEGLHYAAAKGLPVIIMEPLLGGRLARTGPELQKIWDGAPVQRTPVEWALRWLWNQPEVTLVLSGMSAMEHVEENLRIAGEAQANSLTDEELAVIEMVKEFYLARTKVDCTGCDYCAECPGNVRISAIFEYYNDAFMYDEHEATKRWYKRVMERENDWSRCTDCGQCEELCPQHLEIRRHLEEFHQAFSK